MILPFPKAVVLVLLEALALLLLVACSATSPNGNWVLEEFVDPIDDSTITQITLEASENVSDALWDVPMLIVGCSSENLENLLVAVDWGRHMRSDGLHIVETRVDNEEPMMDTWDVIGDTSTAVSKPNEMTAILTRAEKFTVRISPLREKPTTAVWYPVGFSQAYRPVFEACYE